MRWFLASWAIVLLCVGALAADDSAAETLPPASAVEPDQTAWTLDELEEYAQIHSPRLREAAQEVQVQRGRAWQAGLYPNPVADGGSTQLGGSTTQFYGQLSQEIVTKHKLKLDRAAISQEVVQAELRFVRTRFDLLTDVRQGFYTTLTAQRRREVIEQLMAIVRRSAEAAQALERGGEGSRGDTLLLELELERADVSLQNAGVQLQAAQRQLAATLGDPDLIIERLDANLMQPLPDYPFQLTETGVLTRNALVQAAQVEIERNRILLDRAIVEPFPNITVTGGYLHQATGGNIPPQPPNQAIIQLAMPLPIWNKNQGNIAAAQASIGRAGYASRRTQVELIGQLAGATGRFDVARQQVAKYEKSIMPKARETVKISQQGFQQGQFDLLRVLQSQRALIESQLNYLNAQESRWTAAAEIAGLLQEEEFPRETNPE
jgi:cobalt-zinc-cadmium efflux system outer membrane protein